VPQPGNPQALNRYRATPWGAPGVAEGASHAGIPPILSTTGLSALSAGGGMALSAYARASGVLFIQANERLLARAGYADLFTRLNRPGRGYSALYASRRAVPDSGQTYRVLDTNEAIDLDILKSAERREQWRVRYPRGEHFFPLNDTGLKRLLRSTGGEFGVNFALNLALAIPEMAAPWQNPYFNTEQRVVQNIVTVGGAGAAAGVATWISFALAGAELGAWGGPVTFVVGTAGGVVVFVVWEGVVKPTVSWVATTLERRDPYQEYRYLKPLGGGQ
jgi:hypothetical protein